MFVESFAPPPRMIVFGAIDFAAAVAKIGTLPRLPGDRLRRPPGVRHRVPVPGRQRGGRRVAAPLPGRPRPRPAGSTGARCCACSPTTRSSTCRCWRSRCGCRRSAYIGAMGSRRTHDDRLERLRERGLTEAEIARMSSPIGLDLGRAHPGGDRGVDRRRDDRPALGRRGRAARGAGRPDPRRLRPDPSVRTGPDLPDGDGRPVLISARAA